MKKEITVQTEEAISKTGNKYIRMYVDLGYRKLYLSFDKYMIAEIFGVAVEELYKKEK